MPPKLKIGLTGGIGSGKSAVSDRFAALGVPVIDADRVAREVVEPGQPAFAEIRELFSDRCLGDDGRLDRAWLRRRVFGDAEARRRLEAILHPRIRAEMAARAERLTTPYCILAIPLLFETGQEGLVDRVLVVSAPEVLRRQRVAARDGLSEEEIAAILAAQLGEEERRRRADDLIDNVGPLTGLDAAVAALHIRYLAVCDSRESGPE